MLDAQNNNVIRASCY